MLACKGISATRAIDFINCIKHFVGYLYFTFDINTTVSTCIETLLRINIRARIFEFLPPYFQGSNMAVSTSQVCANILFLFYLITYILCLVKNSYLIFCYFF